MLDLAENRLEVAKTMGADFGIKVEMTDDPAVTAKKVEAALGDLADITIECSGAESSIKLAILVLDTFDPSSYEYNSYTPNYLIN